MESSLVRKSKWFWQWQDEAEERWLAEMARQGLHLQKVGVFGSYFFQQGMPRDMVYRLDFKTDLHQATDEYRRPIEDAGWEHVGEFSNWQYFRRPAGSGASSQMVMSPSSKITKYGRVLRFMLTSLPIYFLIVVVLIGEIDSTIDYLIVGLLILVALIYLFALAALAARLLKLRRGNS